LHVLLTNDDGIHSPGIKALWEEFSQTATVSVVAPDSERSACSQSITVHSPIWVSEYDLAGITAFKVGGTPTDCVKLALKVLLPERPDIIVSGINNGSNLGTDVLYSGTVSAAIEGALSGVPSIAVSLDYFDGAPIEGTYANAAKVAREVAESVLKNSLPPNTLLNVNLPAIPVSQIKGRAVTKLGIRHYENTFEKRQDPWGKTYYWMGGEIGTGHNDPDSDIIAIDEGKISITPVHFDLTNYKIMNIIESWQL
jgi:5'-nucleotidase